MVVQLIIISHITVICYLDFISYQEDNVFLVFMTSADTSGCQACRRLHQVRTRRVGINQIRTVYEKVWRGGDLTDAMINEDFTRMMFREIDSVMGLLKPNT